jgi:hypothetical protein
LHKNLDLSYNLIMANAAPANATELLTVENRASLEVMLQNANGDNVYSNEKALFGFIPASQFLLIPRVFHDAANTRVNIGTDAKDFPDISLATFGGINHVKGMLGGTTEGTAYRARTAYLYYSDPVLLAKIQLMNYVALRASGIDPANSYASAALRARWIALGAYHATVTDNARPFDETRTIIGDANGDAYAQMAAANTLETLFNVDLPSAIEMIAESRSDTHGAKWVVSMSETIWNAEEYVVRVRGHHYKKEYETMLKKFISACHEGNVEFPPELDMETTFRTSIHPFGLAALANMASHFAVHGKVGNAGLVRFSGAPNGIAVVTTTAACLRAMAGEPWYGRFRNLYGASIDLLEKMETLILSNKFGFHMSARLYGAEQVVSVAIDGENYTIERVKDTGANLAAIAQGFVEAMKQAVEGKQIAHFSFSNAKVMEKYSANNPLSTLRIRTLVLYALDAIGEAKSVKAATASALPQIEAAEAAATAGNG